MIVRRFLISLSNLTCFMATNVARLTGMPPNQASHTSSGSPGPSETFGRKFRSGLVTDSLLSEEVRLATFLNWPCSFISATELAANGFYYTGVDDNVLCAFCGLEVSQWVEGDSPSRDHASYSPNCDFVMGRPCGNLPLGSSSTSSPQSYDVCGPFGYAFRPYSAPERTTSVSSLLHDLEQLGVSRTSGPVNQNFSNEYVRLSSFKSWPETCPVKPAALAEAGFYSTGVDDHAVCFHCGGGLKDWQDGDDPWVEHARWFSRCAFVANVKGREFIKSCLSSKPAVLPAQVMTALLDESKKLEWNEVKSNDAPVASCSSAPPSASLQQGSECSKECKGCSREMCKVCYAKEKSIVFLPCGHYATCATCASALSACPVCRKPYEATVRVYSS